MPTARYFFGVAAINGILYVVGGSDGPNFLATVEAYDPATDTWTTKASMPTPRYALGVAAVNGILYALGGANSNGVLATVEAYDPVHDTWTPQASMPTPRSVFGVARANGNLYVLGGGNQSTDANYVQPVTTTEAYDPIQNTWTTKASMPSWRKMLGVAAINGLLYAVGGNDVSNNPMATVEAFEP
jgi:N-acetylneuraminic acid mutarotase